MRQRHSKYIGILKHMEKEIGKGKLLEMLKRASFRENVKLGKQLSGRISSLKDFAEPFKNPNSNLHQTIVHRIIEDNEKMFEIRITECLTEIVFREADARELGFACVCYADFGLPAGLSLKLKLIRDKTLMQGHKYCNHRYIWED
jgi:hypothetical protein